MKEQNKYLMEDAEAEALLNQTPGVEIANRAPVRASAGQPPEIIDRYQGGIVSSIGLQTDTANSQLPGHLPVFRLMPATIAGNPAHNASVISTITKTVPAPTPAPPAPAPTSDGLIHGDKIWDADSAVFNIQDQFAVGVSNFSSLFGSLGWGQIGGAGLTVVGGFSGKPPGLAGTQLTLETNFASTNYGVGLSYAFDNVSGTPGGPMGCWALTDNPGWKAVFVFQFYPSDPSTPSNSMQFTNTRIYVGLMGPLSLGGFFGRPDAFIGLRFDTDTASPSIGDTTMKFECVSNLYTGAVNNAQGNVVDTGVVPVVGQYYRLEITCTTAGVVQMSLNGSTPVTITVPPVTIGSSAPSSSQAEIDAPIFNTQTINGEIDTPFAPGSRVTISDMTTPFDVLNGPQTLSAAAYDRISFLTTQPTVASTNNQMTITGYPALTPVWLLNTDSTNSANQYLGMVLNFFALVWNPGVISLTAATPNPNLPRYF